MQPQNHVDQFDTHMRQYRMIQYVSYEFIVVSAVIAYLYYKENLWFLVALLCMAGLAGAMNLWLLIRKRNTKISGHILTLITLVIVTIANYMIRGGGFGTSFSIWFYVVPLLAASLIGGYSFLIYSIASLLLMISFVALPITPFYQLPLHKLNVIDWANHFFAYIIIVTTLYSLMRENMQFESALKDKNYFLQMEKDKYHDLARFDQLTSLPNRSFFELRLQETINSLSAGECATIFFMDLDNLKYVNDHFGHEAGDYLLTQAAIRLLSCFRQNDFIARIGGDEFTAIVIHLQDQIIAEVIAQRVITELNQPFIFKDAEFSSSISVGLATYPTDAKTVASLLINADQAMYAAKKIGGSNYQKRCQLGVDLKMKKP